MLRITIGEILQLCSFLLLIGVWVGGINGLKEDAKEWKQEMRVWMDDAEEERGNIMTKLDTYNQRISKIENYLENKDPAYMPSSSFRAIMQ